MAHAKNEASLQSAMKSKLLQISLIWQCSLVMICGSTFYLLVYVNLSEKKKKNFNVHQQNMKERINQVLAL